MWERLWAQARARAGHGLSSQAGSPGLFQAESHITDFSDKGQSLILSPH